METNQKAFATLLFELGSTQVYHMQTHKELVQKAVPNAVYWQDIKTQNVFGPFLTITECMQHYTWTIAIGKNIDKPDRTNVIKVDFVKKVRIA